MCLMSLWNVRLRNICRSKAVFGWFAVLCLFALPVQAQIVLTDSQGTHTFAEVPQRVVVLNWDLLEQVLELGIQPVGAPELSSYVQWVVQPEVPSSVQDIGTRTEPNLEKIAALKPDVILAAGPQQDLLATLGRIAPVVYLPNFSEQDNAAQVAISHFKTLATLFGKEAVAQQKLEAMYARFSELKASLQHAFGDTLPAVVTLRFANPTSVFLYTENSTPQYVLEQLGLSSALPQPPKEWGIVQKRLSELQHVEQGYVLYFLPFAEEKKVQKSVLWRAMPFVQAGRVNSVRSVWSYGGAMSLRYSAEAITESLLAVAPQS
ncbi:iron-siderophore ABC transporter substrate-binding protein [Vibrio cholerae]|uniref:iron-siderophore ABC transporter substrate-binding protein n=1 Tax=Vibrio cholerae TaxID=666 RepID=UPI000E6A41E7|nr:iron-siderophore ABC transporter substrate-binding protein [Vibrio cholerae]EGR4261784.1 iron-siderophore ABC transporter substrate-binding protein [Vibrio cholerae]EJL9415085.1 iron-siderophore ABC transporter substrate-binding protein [Vibrio cholerae]GIB66539.1 iron(III) ABC transporter, periplasmic iron-compound-binding protein [Vibrio cholerae]HDM0244869.1 iron-siderophore ABC transporter substrate-binding protein [Vibrio cholerae]